MKKILVCLVIGLLLTTGCDKVEQGLYQEGTYYGYVTDTYGGKNNIASAVVYVDKTGTIKSVFLDTVYDKTVEGVDINTTKKALGNTYGMAMVSDNEWYEQVNILEDEIINNQGISFLTLTEDGKTDTISGVTMNISALYTAVDNALKQAKE